MPAFPAVKPPAGNTVDVTLANGSKFPATWDGLQFWVGVNDDPNDIPVNNDFVVSWSHPVFGQ